MIRKKVYVFFAIWLTALLLLPVANVWHNSALLDAFKKREIPSLSRFYQVDLLLPYIGAPAFDLGISMEPNKVLVGKNDWFFLGDFYEHTLSRKRWLAPDDQQAMNTVVANSLLWQTWLQEHGVKSYQIMVAPDKDTLYAEYLPDWAQSAPLSPLDYFQEQTQDSPVYLQLLPAFLAAKAEQSVPLYYGTDSHWNALGGWVAFHAFSQRMQQVAPELKWPDHETVTHNLQSARAKNVGGDLSRFQHAGHHVTDTVVVLPYLDQHTSVVEKSNYRTKEQLGEFSITHADASLSPMLYVNKHALNNARVLWVHDSFGDAVLPFMMQSFESVLKFHSGALTPELFEELVIDYQPDYVFHLVVERQARHHFYLMPAPEPTITAE